MKTLHIQPKTDYSPKADWFMGESLFVELYS